MKKTLASLLPLCAIPLLAFEAADYSIVDVSAKGRAPWQTLVDVDFTLVAPDGAPPDALVQVEVVASNGCERLAISPSSLHAPLAKPGRNRFIWDPAKDHAGRTLAHVRFHLSVADANPEKAPYFTLDLRTGERNWHPADFASRMNGNDLYKTAFMPFRHVPATTSDEWKNAHDGQDFFMMGSPDDEPYRTETDAAREPRVPIRLTKGFWMGVYPVTAFQLEAFDFRRTFTNDGDTAAARGKCAHYSAVRGTDGANSGYCFGKDFDERGWPAVDPQSFIGRMRTLTGLCVDFPTDAQWEYACRAGTTNAYWFGIENIWRGANSGKPGPSLTRYVGGQAPNAWGLYDMVGCVHNWTTTLGTLADGSGNWAQSAADDPAGPVAETSAPKRITRGSHYFANGDGGTDTLGNEIKYIRLRVYRSAYRFPQNSTSGEYEHDLIGFRLCIPEDPE